MAGKILTALVDRAGIDSAAVEDVIMGCVHGGAIALCRQLDASGTKLLATLIPMLRGQRYGLQTMCEGGGNANATIVEAL